MKSIARFGLLLFLGLWVGVAHAQDWTFYEDNDSHVIWGGGIWEQVALPGAIDGTLSYNRTGKATFLLAFEGSGIQLIHSSGPEGAVYTATLYDTSQNELQRRSGSNLADQYIYNQTISLEGLPQGKYILILSSAGTFWLESIKIQGSLLASDLSAYAPQATTQNVMDRTGEFLNVINAFRCQYGGAGIKQVSYSYELFQAAALHTSNMAQQGFADHVDPFTRSTPAERILGQGYYDATLLGENIAVGNADLALTFQQWLDSPYGHREIMLDPQITEIGLAYANAPHVSNGHYWTLDLGSRVTVPPAECPATPSPNPMPYVQVRNQNQTITLSWQSDTSQSGTYFEVAYDTNPNGAFASTLTTTDTSQTINGILQSNPQQAYFFRVRAFNPLTNSFGSYSNTTTATGANLAGGGGSGGSCGPMNTQLGYATYLPYDCLPYNSENTPINLVGDYGLFLPYFSTDIPSPPNRNAPDVPFSVGQITGTVWAEDGLYLREGPSLSADEIVLLPKGRTFPILRRTLDGFWIQLNVNGRIGWAYSHWLTFNGSRFNIPTDQGLTAVVAFANTGVHSGCVSPGRDKAVRLRTRVPTQVLNRFGNLVWDPRTDTGEVIRAGHHVNVLGQSPDGRWIKVTQVTRGLTGWAWKSCFTDAHTYRSLGVLPVLLQ